MVPPGLHQSLSPLDTGFFQAVQDMHKTIAEVTDTLSKIDRNQAVLEERLKEHKDNASLHRSLGEPPCKPLTTHIDSHKKFEYLAWSTLVGMTATLILSLGALLWNMNHNKTMAAEIRKPVPTELITPKDAK